MKLIDAVPQESKGMSIAIIMTVQLKQILYIAVLLLCLLSHSDPALAADDATALRTHYEALRPQLSNSQFQRPLHLDSAESHSSAKGDLYAVLDHSFASVNGTLNDPEQGPANWCDVLMLHLNTKYCHASSGSSGKMLRMNIGKKVEQPLSDTYLLEFKYQSTASSPEYFRIDLNADKGPLGTSDYKIMLEAVALDCNHTFIHLTYSCKYSLAGRIALKLYLATLESDKVGFTIIKHKANGEPRYIGGLRGIIERNTMRYYLAIDAYLSALCLPKDKRLEKRLSNWFSATEQYARQLHVLEREEYMQMKFHEFQRRQTGQ